MTCPHCDQDFEPEEFPFGDDVTCPHCGTVLETDWDYANEDDDRSCWITGIKKGA